MGARRFLVHGLAHIYPRPYTPRAMNAYRTTLIVLPLALLAAFGCSASPDSGDDTTDDSAELSNAWQDLTGAYENHGAGAVREIVFEPVADVHGHRFFANVDNGIRCIKAPCPSIDRVEGWFTAGPKTLTLHQYMTQPAGGGSDISGRYSYTLVNGALSLTRAGQTQTFNDVGSFCDDVSDCSDQAFIHVMCVGTPTCNQNRCGFHCGVAIDAGPDASDAGDASADAKPDAKDAGVRCGNVTCGAGLVCCNPLDGICTLPGEFCTQ